MHLPRFEYRRPPTLAAVLEELQQGGPGTHLLAGGTDLLIRMKQRVVTPALVIDLGAVKDLNTIRGNAQTGLYLGAMIPLYQLVAEAGQRGYPVLAQAALAVASTPLRNQATIGGNLLQDSRCWYYNQSAPWKQSRPACYKAGGEICYVVKQKQECYAVYRGDLAPVLVALQASVILAGPRGERTIPLAEIFSGKADRPHNLADGEVLVGVEVPPAAGIKGEYLKLAHRQAVDFPLAAVAGVAGEQGCRLVLGALGPAPLVLPPLAGSPEMWTAAEIDRTLTAARRIVQTVRNVAHGDPAYRRKMAGVLTRRLLVKLQDEGGNAGAVNPVRC